MENFLLDAGANALGFFAALAAYTAIKEHVDLRRHRRQHEAAQASMQEGAEALQRIMSGEGCGDPDCPNCGPKIKAQQGAAN